MNVEKFRKIGDTGKVQGGLYKNDQIDSCSYLGSCEDMGLILHTLTYLLPCSRLETDRRFLCNFYTVM